MSRRRNRRRHSARLEKSLPAALMHNAQGAIRSADQIAALTTGRATGGDVAPLPRAPFDPAFGPGLPVVPAALDPARRDSGRPQPRLTEYPVSWNLPGTRGRLVPWRVLRDAAELPIISDCIRVRKEEVATLDWEIGVSPKAVAATQRDRPGTSRRSAEADMRQRLLPEMDRLRRFWEEPDPANGLHFPAWISQLLDERLVLDAVAIWPRRTLAGDVIGLALLDGSTVKPLLDEYGGRPQPPYPAFQQILYGFPRGEFTADTVETDAGTVIPSAFSSDQLIYEVRDRRTWTPYGRSPVEAALLDLDTWMKRVEWLRSEYTDGVMPAGWLVNKGGPNSVEWSPAQVFEYETALNDLYGGDTAQRRRYRVLPPGIEPDVSPEVGEKFKPDYDLHLLKMLVAHFDLTIHELGFTETQGLGSAGHAQEQARLNERKGSVPTLRALQTILTRISRRHLGMPEELEWRWTQLATDDDDADDMVAAQVAGGLMTLNEGRDQLGRPRYAFQEADMAAIVAPRTGAITFLDGASQPPEPLPPLPKPGTTTNEPRDGVPVDTDPEAAGSKPTPPKAEVPAGGGLQLPIPPTGSAEGKKAAEAAAYRRWAVKGRGRRFQLEHLTTPADLEAFQIDPGRVTFLPKATDPQPTAPTASDETPPDTTDTWPGWERDQQTADHWARQLRTALAGALALHTLAADWQTQQTTPQDDTTQDDTTDHGASSAATGAAIAFLLGRSARETLATRIAPVTAAAAAEGWLIGQRSAHAALDHTTADWADWTPGHPDTARALIEDPDALAAFTRSLDPDTLADTRLEHLAETLADATTEGWSTDRLTAELRDVLDDPRTAHTTTLTVVVHAAGVAALAVYQAAKVGQVRWVTEHDAQVCPVCDANTAAGPVPTGAVFPSGQPCPPAHPRCRCALAPA